MDGAAKAFAAISLFDEHLLNQLTPEQLRPLLPCLTRMAFCSSLDSSEEWAFQKKRSLQLISHLEEVNLIVSYLSLDFQTIENDWKRNNWQKSNDCFTPGNTLFIELESCTPGRKLVLFMHEIQSLQIKLNSINNSGIVLTRPINSELFDHDIYIDALSDMACVLLSELPNSFTMNDLIDTLLTVKIGPLLICRLALNFSHAFDDICSHLLEKNELEPENVFMVKRRIDVIRALCRMNPSYALIIRSQAMDACRLPALCVYLTIDKMNHDHNNHLLMDSNSDEIMECDVPAVSKQTPVNFNELVSFVSGVLLNDNEKRRQWFVTYIRGGSKKSDTGSSASSVLLLRDQLLKYCNQLYQQLTASEDSKTNSVLIQASALLKLYCAFRGLCSLKLFENEVSAIVNLVTIKPPSNPCGIRFASIGLCMLLAAPLLIASSENERQVINWLQDIVNEPSLFGHVSRSRSSFCEMLLLIAIHFHSNQISPIGELISTVLGIKIPVRQNNVLKMKTIFTQEIFPDHAVTAHAIKVPVTNRLTNEIPGFLPVHCIYQLLKSRAFTKHKVPIKDWIFKQICKSCAPLNPVLPSLIETYVHSILLPNQKNNLGNVNEPITEQELLSIFKHKIYTIELIQTEQMDIDQNEDRPDCWLTTQLLLLYYLLWYEEVRLSQSKSNQSVKKYSSDLWSKIPVYFLIQEAQREQNKYGLFISSLMRLVSTHYPHFCLVTDWLYMLNHKKIETNPPSISKLIQLKDSLEHAFECIQSQPCLLIQCFDRLLNLPDKCIWPFAKTFTKNLKFLLPFDTPVELLDKAKKLWLRLNNIFPDEFQVLTVNAIALNKFTFKSFTWNNIVTDPLQVLRCDRRVFQCPQFMEILLHMLQSFLVASRTHFTHHLMETPSKENEKSDEKEREELRVALVQSQESAAIQILLEACHPFNDQVKNADLAEQKSKEIQKLICIHLHQVFIADPNLAKLVHFQSYDSKLLSLVVSKIPSMHICLDFIPELLTQADLNKQIFSIELCSYLCEHYAIPKSLSIARLCFNVANTLLGILSSEKRALFFVPVLPALIRMCKPFPPLYEDAINLLIQISQICLSQLAANSATFIAPNCSLSASSNVDDIDWNVAKKFFNAMPTNNPLASTIRNSFNTLISIKPVQVFIKQFNN